MSRVRVFLASSLDGFIAGPNDELDWLSGHGEDGEDTFTPFFAQIGAMLMGRRTFDVV
jgi:dihydrofolate reductase